MASGVFPQLQVLYGGAPSPPTPTQLFVAALSIGRNRIPHVSTATRIELTDVNSGT